MKRRLILLGPPGAGKGTVAAFWKQDFGLQHISSGQLLRQEISKKTALGARVQSFIESGELAPDEEIVRFMRATIPEEAWDAGVALDGFPRSVPQAQALDAWLFELGHRVDAAIYCDAPEEVIVGRITGRRTCSKCHRIYHIHSFPPREAGKCDECGGNLIQRADDTPELVHRRLELYARDTAPLKAYYGARDQLIALDCSVDPKYLRVAARAVLS